MNTIESLLKAGREQLESEGVHDPRREAGSLLAYVLDKELAFLIAHPEFCVAERLASFFFDLIIRRSRHEPFHYLTGSREFYGLEFEVNPDVLIPRPETELLVEKALQSIGTRPSSRFCEVGVGSGCIAIAVLNNAQLASAVGLEISEKALTVASRNAERHNVESRLDLRHSDIYQALGTGERFDLIVSNPPYVPMADLPTLQAEVRLFEPHIALTDGYDGLSLIRSIIDGAPEFLVPGGRLLMEIGFGQREAVLEMFQPERWPSASVHPDLQGIPRVVEAVVSNN